MLWIMKAPNDPGNGYPGPPGLSLDIITKQNGILDPSVLWPDSPLSASEPIVPGQVNFIYLRVHNTDLNPERKVSAAVWFAPVTAGDVPVALSTWIKQPLVQPTTATVFGTNSPEDRTPKVLGYRYLPVCTPHSPVRVFAIVSNANNPPTLPSVLETLNHYMSVTRNAGCADGRVQ